MSKWNELLKASENRGKGLGEVKDILEFNEQVDKVQDWIREKVTNDVKKQISHHIRKPAIRICENKSADQLSCNCEADQHLYLSYTDSTITIVLRSEISSFFRFKKSNCKLLLNKICTQYW